MRYCEGRKLVPYAGEVVQRKPDATGAMVLDVRFDGDLKTVWEVEEDGEDDWDWEQPGTKPKPKPKRQRRS